MADPARPPRYPTAGSPGADRDDKRTGDDTRDDGPVAVSGKGHGDGDNGGDDFASDLDGRQSDIAQLPLQKSEMLHAGGIDDEGRRNRNDHQGRSRFAVERAEHRSGGEAKQSKQRADGDVEPEQGGNLRVGNLRSLHCCSRQPAGGKNLEDAGDDGDHRHQAEIARIEKVGEDHDRDESHERPCRLADEPGSAAANCPLLQILQLGAPERIGRRKAGLAVEAALRKERSLQAAGLNQRRCRRTRLGAEAFMGDGPVDHSAASTEANDLLSASRLDQALSKPGGVTLPRFLHTLQPNLSPPGIDPSWAEHPAPAEARPAGDVLQYHRRRLQRLHAPGLLVEKPLHPRDDPVLCRRNTAPSRHRSTAPDWCCAYRSWPGSPRET